MIRPSRISPEVLINESLGAADLAASPMCENGMKLLIYARDNEGITLTKSGGFFRKFVTWAAHEFGWPEHGPEKLFAVNKVLNEQDFFPLAVMHSLLLSTRLIRHYRGRAVLTKAGRAIIGDYGGLQALLFDAYFATIDLSEYERFPIEYEDADLRHYLGVLQNRLDDWVVLADFAGWCLPLDMITMSRIDPVTDACFHLISRLIRPLIWMGLLERQPEQDRTRIEQRYYRKTSLFDRFVRIASWQDGRRSVH